jgi:hypothetical protein
MDLMIGLYLPEVERIPVVVTLIEVGTLIESGISQGQAFLWLLPGPWF